MKDEGGEEGNADDKPRIEDDVVAEADAEFAAEP
jgi:hypothetical protein